MHFNIDKFFDRIQHEELSRGEVSQAIHNEIRDAETQRIAFVDQANENPDFFKFLSGQIDCYIACLQVLHKRIAPEEEIDTHKQTYMPDKAVAYHTMKLLMQLEQLEVNRVNRMY